MMKACGMKNSQHCQKILRRRNARLGDEMDVGFDRVGVTTMLLPCVTVWVRNRKKEKWAWRI